MLFSTYKHVSRRGSSLQYFSVLEYKPKGRTMSTTNTSTNKAYRYRIDIDKTLINELKDVTGQGTGAAAIKMCIKTYLEFIAKKA